MIRNRQGTGGLIAGSLVAISANTLLLLGLPLMNRYAVAARPEVMDVRDLDFVRFQREPLPLLEEDEPLLEESQEIEALDLEIPEPPALPSPSISLQYDSGFKVEISHHFVTPKFGEGLPGLDTQGSGMASLAEPLALNRQSQALLITQPMYPPMAKRMGLQGAFKIEFTIGTDGTVSDIEILSRPTGSGSIFDQAILTAARSWKFSPELSAGQAVRSRVSKTLIFELE